MEVEEIVKEETIETSYHSKDDNDGGEKKKSNVLKYFLNISFVLIVTVLALYLTLKDDFDVIMEDLSGCDYRWILIILGVLVVMIMLRGAVLFFFARLYTREYHYPQGIAVDQIGVFYNAVTPGASGGEIMQAYTFKKQGVPISASVSIMAMYSIIYQTVLIGYGIVSFIAESQTILKMNPLSITLFNGDFHINIPMSVLTIFGFILNVGVILIVLLMGYWHAFHNFIMGPVIGLLSKIRIIKDPEQSRENLRVQVENFKVEFRRLMTNIPFTVLIAILFFLILTLKFSIPYFVGLALGNQSNSASFWTSIFLSNYHQMVTGLIPIPGSAGVSELFFHELFLNKSGATISLHSFYIALGSDGLPSLELSEAMCKASLLIWRSVTFSFPIIIAGFVTAFYKASPKDVVGRDGDIPDRQTLTQLQAETLIMRNDEVNTIIETTSFTRKAIQAKLKEMNEEKKQAKKKKKTSKSSKNDHKGNDYLDL